MRTDLLVPLETHLSVIRERWVPLRHEIAEIRPDLLLHPCYALRLNLRLFGPARQLLLHLSALPLHGALPTLPANHFTVSPPARRHRPSHRKSHRPSSALPTNIEVRFPFQSLGPHHLVIIRTALHVFPYHGRSITGTPHRSTTAFSQRITAIALARALPIPSRLRSFCLLQRPFMLPSQHRIPCAIHHPVHVRIASPGAPLTTSERYTLIPPSVRHYAWHHHAHEQLCPQSHHVSHDVWPVADERTPHHPLHVLSTCHRFRPQSSTYVQPVDIVHAIVASPPTVQGPPKRGRPPATHEIIYH